MRVKSLERHNRVHFTDSPTVSTCRYSLCRGVRWMVLCVVECARVVCVLMC